MVADDVGREVEGENNPAGEEETECQLSSFTRSLPRTGSDHPANVLRSGASHAPIEVWWIFLEMRTACAHRIRRCMSSMHNVLRRVDQRPLVPLGKVRLEDL